MIRYIATLTALTMLACGGSGESGSASLPGSPVEGTPHAELGIVNTIGIELGDTSYVFGRITDVVPTGGGGAVVLDITTMNLRRYGADGTIMETTGRNGSGPGEFQMPRGMALLENGRLAVSDMAGGQIVVFGDSLEWIRNITGFYPRPPFTLRSAGDSSFVGMLPAFDREAGTMGYTIARMESAPDPAVIYQQETYPFDPSRIGPTGEDEQPLFTAGHDGSVYIADAGTDRISVMGYDASGAMVMEIDQRIEPLAKTPEQLADEEAEFEEFASRMGGRGGGRFSGGSIDFDPDPYRRAVTGLGMDGYGRLWVRLGAYPYPFWNVYGTEGELLFTASLELDDPDIDDMVVRIEAEGAAAWVEDPGTWPKVHLLQLPR